jgi:hypothetical protein
MLNRRIRVSARINKIRRATLIYDPLCGVAVLIKIAFRASKKHKNKHKRGYSHEPTILYLARTVLAVGALSMDGPPHAHIALS